MMATIERTVQEPDQLPGLFQDIYGPELITTTHREDGQVRLEARFAVVDGVLVVSDHFPSGGVRVEGELDGYLLLLGGPGVVHTGGLDIGVGRDSGAVISPGERSWVQSGGGWVGQNIGFSASYLEGVANALEAEVPRLHPEVDLVRSACVRCLGELLVHQVITGDPLTTPAVSGAIAAALARALLVAQADVNICSPTTALAVEASGGATMPPRAMAGPQPSRGRRDGPRMPP